MEWQISSKVKTGQHCFKHLNWLMDSPCTQPDLQKVKRVVQFLSPSTFHPLTLMVQGL